MVMMMVVMVAVLTRPLLLRLLSLLLLLLGLLGFPDGAGRRWLDAVIVIREAEDVVLAGLGARLGELGHLVNLLGQPEELGLDLPAGLGQVDAALVLRLLVPALLILAPAAVVLGDGAPQPVAVRVVARVILLGRAAQPVEEVVTRGLVHVVGEGPEDILHALVVAGLLSVQPFSPRLHLVLRVPVAALLLLVTRRLLLLARPLLALAEARRAEGAIDGRRHVRRILVHVIQQSHRGARVPFAIVLILKVITGFELNALLAYRILLPLLLLLVRLFTRISLMVVGQDRVARVEAHRHSLLVVGRTRLVLNAHVVDNDVGRNSGGLSLMMLVLVVGEAEIDVALHEALALYFLVLIVESLVLFAGVGVNSRSGALARQGLGPCGV
jgi:hypothetical protein